MPDSVSYDCALISGASSGLGEEFAHQLAPRVGHLILVARREGVLQSLAERIRAEVPGVKVSIFAADLARGEKIQRLLESIAANGWVPDLLVNNAGLGDYGEFASADWTKTQAMLRVNVEALTAMAHGLLPGMIAKKRGAILNVSSLASVLPIPDFAVYAATKAYVSSFSEALRIEVAEHGIRVCAVCPGPVHTGFGEVAARRADRRDMPGREGFYVTKAQVVGEALAALDSNAPRVFPALKTRLAAWFISAMPLVFLRKVMAFRPRR